MAQISLYIEDHMIDKLQLAAKEQNCSISKFVAAIIKEQLIGENAEESRKKQVLRELRGALNIGAISGAAAITGSPTASVAAAAPGLDSANSHLVINAAEAVQAAEQSVTQQESEKREA